MKYVTGILLFFLVLLSCGNEQKEKETPFIQPQVLAKGVGFDLTQLTFKENFRTLVASALDTIENSYTLSNYESAIYPSEQQILSISDDKRITYLEEKRFYFEIFRLDSVAQFFGLYADNMKIETDADLNIKTVWAYAKVPDKKVLDSLLLSLYKQYGKTVAMEDYKEEYGSYTEYKRKIDEDGNEVYYSETVENTIDYESFLYKYEESDSKKYHQWNLEDRILQIYISKGFEASFSSKETKTMEFYTLELLQMAKEEYDLLKNRVIAESTKNDFPSSIKKPYDIKSLDFYENEQKYRNRNKEDIDDAPEYDFKQQKILSKNIRK